MIDLTDVLAKRSHRDLELTSGAHQVPFTRREAKAIGLAKLTAALRTGVYEKAFQTLDEREKEALQALVKGGGALPLLLFSHHFGEIRPYRPWRKSPPSALSAEQGGNPRHPWRFRFQSPRSSFSKLSFISKRR